YTYSNPGVTGIIHEEKNGGTDQVMTTLDNSTSDKKVLYANGRLQKFEIFQSQMGAVNKYTDGVGAETKYTYDDGGIGFLKTETDTLGRVTTYNARTIYGNLLEITYPDGSKEKWTRDSLDQVLTYTDHFGRITTYTRDSRHRPVRIDYPDG